MSGLTIKQLEATLRVLDENGWTRGRYRNDMTGQVCLIGGFNVARNAELDADEDPIAKQFARELGFENVSELYTWNDSIEREVTTVKRRIERAIEARREANRARRKRKETKAMDIGEEIGTITVEPATVPVPQREQPSRDPVPQRAPARTPSKPSPKREPAKVPAK